VKFGTNNAIGVQTGTVAGRIQFSWTLDLPVPPPPLLCLCLYSHCACNHQHHDGHAVGNGVVLNMFSNTRDATTLRFVFNTTPAVLLSCGGVSGCSVTELRLVSMSGRCSAHGTRPIRITRRHFTPSAIFHQWKSDRKCVCHDTNSAGTSVADPFCCLNVHTMISNRTGCIT